MNVLILSCGTRNKVVRYFRETVKERGGKVIATDCSSLAPALYEADRYYIVKRIDEAGYIEQIWDICEENDVDGVLSLIDPELSLLAKHEKAFRDIGTEVIGSSYELCEMSLDKYKMYRWLDGHNYNCAKSYMDKQRFYDAVKEGLLSYPVFVKPMKGSASTCVSIAGDRDTVEVLKNHESELMIQEYLDGQEIGADVYVDVISGEVVSMFTKKKLKMRAGETDKAVSFKDKKCFELIERFVTEAGYRGQIDIDIFDVGGEYYISEVNPRFGGGYPHAHECGCNHVKLIMENLQGRKNVRCIGNYEEGTYMMKYNEVRVMKG